MKKIIILSVLLALSLFSFNCGGGSGSSNSPKGENPGEPSVVQLLPSHFIAQTNSIITLHAKVLDGNGAPVNNIPVSFTNLSPIGVLNSTTAQTNNTGIATVTLKSTTSGFSTVQVEVNKGTGQVRDRKTVFFTAQNVLAVRMNMDVDSVPGNGVYNEKDDFNLFNPPPNPDDTVEILATVLDAGGVRAPGQPVTWSADHTEVVFVRAEGVTNVFGEAKAVVQVAPESIRDTETHVNVMAFAENGAANMVSLFLQPVTVSDVNVSADPSVVAPGDTSAITASVVLNTGHPAPDGTAISFIASCGTVTPFAQTTSGVATADFTAPSTAGTCTVTATAAGVSDTVDVTVTTALTVQPTAQTIDGTAGGTASFRIFGGIPSYSVFSNNPLFLPVPTTLASSGGTFRVTVPANTPAGSVTLTIRDQVGTTVNATLTITVITPVPLTVAPMSATICENNTTCSAATDIAVFTILGGTPPYSATQIAPAGPPTATITFVTSTIFTVDWPNNTIGADTPVTISVTDSATGSQLVTVTVINQI